MAYYDTAADFAVQLADDVIARGLPFGTCLNVNIPDRSIADIAGVIISRQEFECLTESFERRTDPRNRTYYWQGREILENSEQLDVDGAALFNNYISITPIKCDVTDYKMIETLKSWGLEKAVTE